MGGNISHICTETHVFHRCQSQTYTVLHRHRRRLQYPKPKKKSIPKNHKN